MTDVLRKIHKSLRDDGLLLVFQPEARGQLIEVEVDDRAVFREEPQQPDFTGFVRATKGAIDTVVQKDLFVRVDEVMLPDRFSYESVDDWVENEGLEDPFTPDDTREVETMATRIRETVMGREHRVRVSGNEYTVLLQKREP